MERLGPSGGPSSSSSRPRRGKIRSSKGALFSRVIENFDVAPSQVADIDSEFDFRSATLESLLDGIYEVGEKLKKTPDRAHVVRYKAVVKRFIEIVLERGLGIEETTSSPNILKQKRFTLVKVIDQKLERLASGVLQNQRDTLEILGKIDEINGLLVDLIS